MHKRAAVGEARLEPSAVPAVGAHVALHYLACLSGYAAHMIWDVVHYKYGDMHGTLTAMYIMGYGIHRPLATGVYSQFWIETPGAFRYRLQVQVQVLLCQLW